MKFVLVSVALLCGNAALAEEGSVASSGDGQGSVRTEAPKTGNVPAGGCMPIGLTARGEMVFPMQCRELLERERGPTPLTLGAPQAAAPASQPEAAIPEWARLSLLASKLSADHRRKLHRPPAAIQAAGAVQTAGAVQAAGAVAKKK
jgi:hypothetical protein